MRAIAKLSALVALAVTTTVPAPRRGPALTLVGARCSIAGKRVPCARLTNGVARKVRIDGVWLGSTVNAQKIAG